LYHLTLLHDRFTANWLLSGDLSCALNYLPLPVSLIFKIIIHNSTFGGWKGGMGERGRIQRREKKRKKKMNER
jgi:hypothetical protein